MTNKALSYACTSTALLALVVVLTLGLAPAAHARKANQPQLTSQGQQLEQRYAGMLEQLRVHLESELPEISPAMKSAYESALESVRRAKADIEQVEKQLGEIGRARGLVGHATGHWIPKAKRNIAQAEKALKSAKTPAEREKAEKELEKWQKDLAAGQQALKERTAAYEQAKRDKPTLERKLQAEKNNLQREQARLAAAMDRLRIDRVLASDQLDGKLAKYVVLKQATPAGLAAYAQQSAKHAQLVDRLLADEPLMTRMLRAEGAAENNYGKAIEIYDAIQQKYPTARQDGIFNNLALAIALEHATPIGQQNAKAQTNAPRTVDPIARYGHYEQAYLAGELDPYFDTHSPWELRHVVNGNEPDHILAWGRQMLRNYRPDHITTKDDRWRYVALVRTCIRYGSDENKHDKDELHFFQNILMNGGVCGRRAFIGRFILRSFGVPTVAKPQRGHAALGRWTPDGWVAVLGAGWNTGWAPNREMAAADFLAKTQARELGSDYLQVLRAYWIGDLNGEPRKLGFDTGRHKAEFWNSIALNRQKELIEKAGTKAIAAVGEELGEANTSDVKYPFESAEVTEADRQVSVDANGTITIPAAATTSPTRSTGKVLFLDSVLGGKQLTYNRNGGDQDFTYTFDAPEAGTYTLTMKVVTPSWKQKLNVIVNGGQPISTTLPHTVGQWQTTEPITVTLKKGENTLTFTRKGVKQEVADKGFAIKHYTLTPASDRG